MAHWARSVRRLRTSPPPRQAPPRPPRPHALGELTSFARRRQQERALSVQQFNKRNAAFQRELVDRLEQVRLERDRRYPPHHQSTPQQPQINIPSHSYSTGSSSLNSSTISIQSDMSRQQTPDPYSMPRTREATPAPDSPDPNRSTPIIRAREPTPGPSNQVIPDPSNQDTSSPIIPNANVEPIYDVPYSPPDSIYESVANSPSPPDHDSFPENALPSLPPTPQPPQPRFSRFGRLLKRTIFLSLTLNSKSLSFKGSPSK